MSFKVLTLLHLGNYNVTYRIFIEPDLMGHEAAWRDLLAFYNNKSSAF